MPTKITKNFRIFEEQHKDLDELAEQYGSNRSKIVRRAIDFYDNYGIKNDKVIRGDKSEYEPSKKVTVNLRIFERHHRRLDELAEEWECDRSILVRRSIVFYDKYGIENDKVMNAEMKGNE